MVVTCNHNFVTKYRTPPDNIVINMSIKDRVVGRDERTGNILYGDYVNT